MAQEWTAARYGAPLVALVRIWPGEENNPLVLWPYEGEGRGHVSCWQPIGQHGAADLRPDGTRPATEAEARDALRRWHAEHPADRPPADAWRILRRAPPYSVLSRAWREEERARSARVAAMRQGGEG